MRLLVTLTLSVAVAGILSGCSTTGMSWRAAMGMSPKAVPAEKSPTDPKPKESVAAAEPAKEKDKSKDKPSDKVADATEKSSPFKPSREKPVDSTAAKASEPAVAKPVVAAKPTTEPQSVSWSPETVQLIGDELRDATPEERAEWHETLKHVDVATIPDILRARRMSRQAAPVASRAPSTEPERRDLDSPSRRPLDREFGWSSGRPDMVSRESEFTIRDRDEGRVQPVGFTNPSTTDSTNRVTQAGYRTPADQPQRVDFASNQVPQRTNTPANNGPVVLQGYVVDDSIPSGSDSNRASYATIGGTSPPRTYPTTPADSTSIAWPPPSNKPTVSNPSSRGLGTSSLPFGTGFVQNVVGLVPNRGNSATPNPPAPLSQPIAGTLPWRAELERTIAALEQEVATLKPSTDADVQNDYLRKHVALRQLYLLTDRQERALTAIPGIDPADQEFWQQVFWGMSNYMDVQHIPRPQDRASQTISQMSTAIRRLQEQADLQIRNVAFCRQIQYFGNYERFPRDEFRPGQEVLLYAEVENFKSEPTADGQYRTLLRSTIEILSPNGELRKQIDFAATEDLCRNYRRDYFHNYQFLIPERIPLGPHTLKLTVFDELSGRMVSYTTNFNVQ